jgi:two-component system chemotaxis response regulator CheB
VDRILEKPIQVPQLLEIITDEVQKASANATFSGRVNGVDLLEYMQLLLLNGQQVVLEILSTDGAEGFIFLDKGEILHAACGNLEGEEALYRLLTFKGGSFTSLPWRPLEEATINKPAQFLLIEAARKRDDIRSTAKPT